MTKKDFIQHLTKVNRTKSDKAYLIGMAEPHNATALYYDSISKEEVNSEFLRVIETHTDKLAKRLVNAHLIGPQAQAFLELLKLQLKQ